MSRPQRSVGLRRKLAGLLAAFAVFAVLAAGVTIYGLQWRLQGALEDFGRTLGRVGQVDRLEISFKEQLLLLRDVVDGRDNAIERYFDVREEFFALLHQSAAFDPRDDAAVPWSRIMRTAEQVAVESDRCLDLVRESKHDEARAVLALNLSGELADELSAGLRDAKATLDALRNQATKSVGTTTSDVLILTVSVAIIAAGLVIFGVMQIRRWLILPIAQLQEVTEHFSRGDFTSRARLHTNDELGALGTALNEMAQSLSGAQEKLSASETKHRLLFDNLRDAVVICDAQGSIVEYHDSDTRVLGVGGQEHLGRHFRDVWPEWDALGDNFSLAIEAAINEGRRHRAVDVELTQEGGGAVSVCVDVLVYRIEYGGAKYAAVVLRDVTERQRLQHKLRQAETMEAVGTLAGGLAHDFNNLLAGVIGSLSMLATEISDSRHAEKLRSVVQTCWQAASLSRRLLNFAGSAHGEPQVFCVNDAVKVIIDSLDPSFVEGVEVDSAYGEPVSVRMDRDQFTQIVLNLVRNARDAMLEGGILRIEVGNRKTRDPEHANMERPYAIVIVQDTGIGMSPEVQRRVFEPFFTTKSRATRRGRGMGLAISYSAIRNAGGFVQMESEPGKGTSFTVHLPLWEGPADVSEVANVPAAEEVRKGAILLVEEDVVIRDASATTLRQADYSVITADSAEDARVKVRGAGAGNIVLALIDMDLSDGDSLELSEHLLSTDPNLGVILTTADSKRSIPPHLEARIHAQLEKPFSIDALIAAVAAALVPSQSR